MKSFADVIALWPSAEDFARDIGERGGTARQWVRRNSIPAHLWPRVISAASKRGLTSVTTDLLAGLAASSRKQRAA